MTSASKTRRVRNPRRPARRGVASLETLMLVGVTLPTAVGLFFVARSAVGRLFHIIQMLVDWPLL